MLDVPLSLLELCRPVLIKIVIPLDIKVLDHALSTLFHMNLVIHRMISHVMQTMLMITWL